MQISSHEFTFDMPQSSEPLYVVEEVKAKKVENGITYYLLKWAGWPSDFNSWEPEDNLQGIRELLEEFNQKWFEMAATNRSKSPIQNDCCQSEIELPSFSFNSCDEPNEVKSPEKRVLITKTQQTLFSEKGNVLIQQATEIKQISEQILSEKIEIATPEKVVPVFQNYSKKPHLELHLTEGSFVTGDIPDEILSVEVVHVGQNGEKVIRCLLRWKNRKEEQALRPSIISGTIIKQKCPHLLIDFYQAHLKILENKN